MRTKEEKAKYAHDHFQKNKIKILARRKKFKKDNPERVKENRLSHRELI